MNTLQKFVGALTVSLAAGAHADYHDSDFELLEPGVAFGASAIAIDDQTLQIDFAIADGYYLYHDKSQTAIAIARVRTRVNSSTILSPTLDGISER